MNVYLAALIVVLVFALLYILFNSGSQSKPIDPPPTQQYAGQQQQQQPTLGAAQPKPQVTPQPQGPANHKVVELQDGTSTRAFMEQKQAGILLVYAPWCGHCKMMMPNFEAASNEVPLARFARLEGAKAQDFMREKQIRGFPTLFTVNQKGEVAPYQSGRDTVSLANTARALLTA